MELKVQEAWDRVKHWGRGLSKAGVASVPVSANDEGMPSYSVPVNHDVE